MDPLQPYRGLGRNPNSAIPKANPPKGLQVGPLRSPAKLLDGPLQGRAEHSDVRTFVELLPKLVRSARSQRKHPFYVIPIKVVGGFEVTIEHGFIQHKEAGSNNEILTYTSVPELLTDPVPTYAVTNGDKIYLNVATSNRGIPTAAFIYVSGTPPVDTEFIPPVNGIDGQDGDLFYEIAHIEITGSLIKVSQVQSDNVVIDVNRTEIEHVGGYSRIFKEYDPATGNSKFRTLRGLGGITVTETTDTLEIEDGGGGWTGTIQLDFLDEINGSYDDYLLLTFTNGKLTEVNDGAAVTSPGAATFSSRNSLT